MIGSGGNGEAGTSLLSEEVLASGLGLDAAALRTMGSEMRRVVLGVGEVLVQEGSAADELYLLLDGRLEVLVGVGADEQHLTMLGPGSIVGEIALLAGDARSATVRSCEASRLVAISEVGFRRLVVEHPAAGEALARRAAERLRETQLMVQLNRLFGRLEPAVLAAVKDLIEWMPMRAGARLFAEGDEGDAVYFVVSGRVRAFRTDADGMEHPVGEIGRGEMVGEMALLERAPRSATVYAVRDSQLVRFSRAAFESLLASYPSVALLMAMTVIRRSQGSTVDSGPRRLSVVVVPGSPTVDAGDLARQLTRSLGPEAHYVTSAAVDRDLGVAEISQVGDDAVGAIRLGYWLEELQERHQFLVYGIDDDWSPWSRRALRWADHVLVIADADGPPEPQALERELWRLVELQKHPKVSLALVHPADTVLPSGTRAWVDRRALASHHHVRAGDQVSIDRLARLLAGGGTSLVLGGGGARGFAHLGSLVVLDELGIPIDMVGGTSIGSIMALGPAMGWTAEETRQTVTEQLRKIFDYTLPAVSVLKGERISSRLRQILGDIDIVDLWLPYFCVSVDLTTARSRYHDHGPLVEAIRASIAIPGLLPPVPWEGHLLVDGGILDNVPVDEMRRRNPAGRVIAVDVAPRDGPAAPTDYGLSISGFRATLGRLRGMAPPPSLLSTMVRSTLIASVRDRDRVVRERVADLYVDVTIDGGGLLDFGAAEHIAATAESSVRPILRTWARAAGAGDVRYVQAAAAGAPVLTDTRWHRRGDAVLLLTLRDLQHRAVRFAAVVAATAVVLALLFLMTGLVEQFHREPKQTAAALGADQWLLREGVSGAFTSAATMPADIAEQISGADAAPVVVARHSYADDGAETDIVVIGFEAGGLGEPEVVDGEVPSAPGEALIDTTSGFDPGDEIVLAEQRFTITGTTEDTTMFAGMPLVFLSLADAQDLVYRGQPVATAILLSGQPDAVPEGFELHTPDQIAEDGLRPLDGAISSIEIIRYLLWFVAAMIIGTMIYLSALERRRDVAVLTAVGASTAQMAASIALQGVLIALASALIASVLQAGLVPVFPMQVSVPSRAFTQVPVIAVLVALVSGAVGLRKTVRVDPAVAFSGPGS